MEGMDRLAGFEGKAWSSKVVYSLNHALSHIHLMSCKIINGHMKLFRSF